MPELKLLKIAVEGHGEGHGGAESGTQSYSAGAMQKNSASDTVCSSKTSKKEIRLWLQSRRGAGT